MGLELSRFEKNLFGNNNDLETTHKTMIAFIL